MGNDSSKIKNDKDGNTQKRTRSKSEPESEYASPSLTPENNLNMNRKLLLVKSKSEQDNRGIIIVHKPPPLPQSQKTVITNESLIKLMNLPSFRPIIDKSSRHNPFRNEYDSTALSRICYQLVDFLMRSSRIVAYDQNLLANKIKDIDFEIEHIHCKYQNRKCQMNVFEKQLQVAVSECQLSVIKCQKSISKSYQLLHSINNMLDSNDKFDDFFMKSG